MATKGIDEAKKKALARELAANVRGVAKCWPIAGTAAMKAVKQRMPLGASNRFMLDDAPCTGSDPLGLGATLYELKRHRAAGVATRAVDDAIDRCAFDGAAVNGARHTDPIRIELVEATGYFAMMYGGGNCQYQAGATFMALREAGVGPIDLIYIFRRSGYFGTSVGMGDAEHATVVIGIQEGFPRPQEPDFTRWQPTAVVADTWETDRSESVPALAKRYPLADYRFISYARAA